MCLQAFALLSDKLEPLVDGVRRNKEHWLDVAAANKLTPATNHDRDSSNEEPVVNSIDKSKPTTPNSTESTDILNHNNCTTETQNAPSYSD